MRSTYGKMADEELVGLFSKGDNLAFETLLLRHKQRVFSYIYNIIKEENIANDIFQETFIKVITTIKSGRYNSEGKFMNWVTRIAHNLTIDHYRRLAAEKTVSNDDYEDFDILNSSSLCDTSQQDYSEWEDLLTDVENLKNLLPEEQRKIVDMRFYQKLSFKEISDIENISINTALGRMRYALLNMRRYAKKHNIQLTA